MFVGIKGKRWIRRNSEKKGRIEKKERKKKKKRWREGKRKN